MISIDPKFILTNNNLINSILAVILIWLYLSFTFRVIYEIKSTIYNTIVVFRASIAYKLLSFVEDDYSNRTKRNKKRNKKRSKKRK